MTRRLGAVVLCGQSPVLLFGAFAARGLIATSTPGLAATYLWVGLLLAAACLVAAALLRTPVGLGVGWLVQLATLACGVVVPTMILVGLLFTALWVTALVQGRRMDALTRAYHDGAHGGSAP